MALGKRLGAGAELKMYVIGLWRWSEDYEGCWEGVVKAVAFVGHLKRGIKPCFAPLEGFDHVESAYVYLPVIVGLAASLIEGGV